MAQLILHSIVSTVIQINHEPPVNISCPSNLFNETLKCVGNVDSADVMNVIAEPRIHDDRITSYSEFWYFFIAMAISWIGMAVVVSVGDAICFDLLGKRHELYGNQRLWGAVGWGTFSIIAGLLVDENSTVQSYKNYTVIFILMAIALLPDMLISSCLEVKVFYCIEVKSKIMFAFLLVQAEQSFVEHSERCWKTVQVFACHCVLCLVHCNRILYGIDLEFPLLALGRFGRSEGRVSCQKSLLYFGKVYSIFDLLTSVAIIKSA